MKTETEKEANDQGAQHNTIVRAVSIGARFEYTAISKYLTQNQNHCLELQLCHQVQCQFLVFMSVCHSKCAQSFVHVHLANDVLVCHRRCHSVSSTVGIWQTGKKKKSRDSTYPVSNILLYISSVTVKCPSESLFYKKLLSIIIVFVN